MELRTLDKKITINLANVVYVERDAPSGVTVHFAGSEKLILEKDQGEAFLKLLPKIPSDPYTNAGEEDKEEEPIWPG